MTFRKYPAVLQKGNLRYSFEKHLGQVRITRYENLGLGASVMRETVSAEEAAETFDDLLRQGWHKFRSLAEVSWYATVRNNTPYKEEWTVKGQYLVPVNSRAANVGCWN